MLRKVILAAALICSAMLGVESGGAAAPEVRKLDSSDLSIVIGAYVDSVVELRQLLLACAQTEPLHWDEASAVAGRDAARRRIWRERNRRPDGTSCGRQTGIGAL